MCVACRGSGGSGIKLPKVAAPNWSRERSVSPNACFVAEETSAAVSVQFTPVLVTIGSDLYRLTVDENTKRNRPH